MGQGAGKEAWEYAVVAVRGVGCRVRGAGWQKIKDKSKKIKVYYILW